MFRGASSIAKASLFFGDDLFRLRFQSVQDDFQHHFARMANATDGSIVLTLLLVSFLGKINYRLLSACSWPVCQIWLQMLVRMSITASPPFFNNSAGMLSFPAAFPFFNDLTTVSTSSRIIGKSSSFDDSCLARTLVSPLVWKLYSSEQYSFHPLMTSFSSVRHFPSLS